MSPLGPLEAHHPGKAGVDAREITSASSHYLLRFYTPRGGYVSDGKAFPTLATARDHAHEALCDAPNIIGVAIYLRGEEVERIRR